MLTSLLLNYLFVLSVIVIWFMVVYQFLLWALGYRFSRLAARERAELDAAAAQGTDDLPGVSILLPAHNEEMVIEQTLASLLALRYPAEFLEILVIDDASTDRTGELAARVATQHAQVRLLQIPKGVGGRGKAAALNTGLSHARYPILAIYDADNTPEPDSLAYLVRQLQRHPELAAVLGKFRCRNRHRNWLTRFVNIEGISFQWMIQAGRWMLMRFCSLPGTNYVIRREALEKVGGWDEQALTEDAELTLRLYEAGYLVKFAPYAVTWEQEPETLRVWWRQRNRWVRGYNYMFRKFSFRIWRLRPRALAFEILYSLSIYYVFFLAVIISDLLFVFGVLGWILIPVPGPYREVWIVGFLLFVLELVLTLSLEPEEDSLYNIALTVPMYLTYSQLWIPLVIQGFWQDFISRKESRWVKTERFPVDAVAVPDVFSHRGTEDTEPEKDGKSV